MPIAWDEDPPGAGQQILENATALLRDIAAAADRRLAPSVAMRPGNPYGLAAMASMSGNHVAAVAAFDQSRGAPTGLTSE